MDGEKNKSSDEIRDWLGEIFEPYWDEGATGKRADPEYYLPSRDEVLTFIKENPVEDLGDCNYYCEKLRVLAIEYSKKKLGLEKKMCLGYAWGNFDWMQSGKEYHCCNFVVEAGWNFNWIEPQTGRTYELNQCQKGSLKFILF